MFKRLLIAAVAATGFAASSAMATPTADTFLAAYDSDKSGKAAEIALFEDATGLDFDKKDLRKIDGNGGATFDVASQLWVIDVAPFQPGYFLLKFGVGANLNTNLNSYIFKNTADMTQLVWSNSQVNFLTGGDCSRRNDASCNIGRLSHISWVPGMDDGGGNPGGEVPEPASLALLGAGLAGLALRRRRC